MCRGSTRLCLCWGVFGVCWVGGLWGGRLVGWVVFGVGWVGFGDGFGRDGEGYYVPVMPSIPPRNSASISFGEKILYRYSFCAVFGLTTLRRVLILKKPAFPTPFSTLSISPEERVVRIVSGT